MSGSHVLMCASVLCALAGSAVGQLLDPTPPVAVEEITTDIYGNVITSSPYQSRAVGVVWDNGFALTTGAFTNGTTIGSNHILEDFDLTGGPLGNAPVKRITAIGFTTTSVTAGCTPPQVYDCLIEIFDESACDYTQPDMISPTAVPLWTARSAYSQNCGVQTLRTINLAPNGVGGAGDVSFVLPTNKGYVRFRNVHQGTTALRSYTSFDGIAQVQGFVFGTGNGANLVGTITPSYGRDMNGDGTNQPFPYAGNPSGLQGGTPVIVGAAAGAHEHRRTSSTLNTAMRMKLDGDITCTAPAATALGDIPNGTTVQNTTLAAGETKWFTFNIGPVNDAAQTYLDIDTEGSGMTDLTLGLYDSQGTRIAFDLDEGSGVLPQLTFGLGRRGPSGDGSDYDGRDGQPVAGTYYIGVGGSATAFLSCFGVNNTSTDSGAVTLRVRTNASTSGAVPPEPSVAPTPAVAGDFGTVLAPGFQTTDVAAGPLTVTWYRFNMAEATDATTWLDLDTSYSSGNSTDAEIAIYDANGNLVATDDDDGLGTHSSISFGAPSAPREPRPAQGPVAAGLPMDGRDGNLSVGTYYVAVALFDMAPRADRWHVRTNSGSSLGVTLTVTTNSDGISNCSGTACGDQDFNGDGDFGTDQDIEAFFACLGGNCCATCFCQGSDFNGDGDFGTDQDIEAFFRVLGGGNC